MKHLSLLVALTIVASGAIAAQQPVTNVADSVARIVQERYVFPDAGDKIAAHLRAQSQKGHYDRLEGGELADALTRDLRAINNDRHLYVTYQPAQAGGAPSFSGGAVRVQPGAGPVRVQPGRSPAMREMIRRRNYYLNRVERLEGNIGYLEIRQFFGSADEAREALAGAMAFLAQTDAMIIDVREAPGGDAGMVDLVASFFFDKVTPTLSTYSRPQNQTVNRATLENVPGKRRPDVPLYVLTSRNTGSAAEDFAFLLQQTGRATLVGDRTAGAGHMNAIMSIPGGFSVSVSIGRTFNPKTNEGWEGTGVQPHVRVTPTEALHSAHRLALTTLVDRTQDGSVRRELMWSRDALDARHQPVSVDEKVLRSYVGSYGVRVMSFEKGTLWYQRQSDVEKVPLTPLSATEFAMGEGQRFLFEVRNGSIELRLLMPDGTHVAYTRTP